MNDAMSFGVHRCWKDVFMSRLAPPRGTKLLDVAGGTGAHNEAEKISYNQRESEVQAWLFNVLVQTCKEVNRRDLKKSSYIL